MTNIISIKLEIIVNQLLKKEMTDEKLEELLSSFDLNSLNLIIEYISNNFSLTKNDSKEINVIANKIIDVITRKISIIYSDAYEFFNEFNNLNINLCESILDIINNHNLNIDECMDLILQYDLDKSEIMYIIDILLMNGNIEKCITFSTADNYTNYSIVLDFIYCIDENLDFDFDYIQLHIIKHYLPEVMSNTNANSEYFETLYELLEDFEDLDYRYNLDLHYFQKHDIIDNYNKIRILK
ncbi:MAG: hypothetical protein R3Y13_04790 [bacterium]